MTGTGTDWRAWQQSWDRQQEWYMPDREERFRVMLDMVEALVGPEPRVLDLACGTGSITDRLFERFPEATSTGVDLDPALCHRPGLLRRRRARHLRDRRPQGPRVDRRGCRTTRTTRSSPPPPCTGCQRTAGRAVRPDRRARPGRRRVHERRPHDRPRHPPDQRRRARPPARRAWTAPRPRAPWTGPSGGRSPPRTRCSPGRPPSGYEIYGEHADGDMPVRRGGTPRRCATAGFGEARAVWASPSDRCSRREVAGRRSVDRAAGAVLAGYGQGGTG